MYSGTGTGLYPNCGHILKLHSADRGGNVYLYTVYFVYKIIFFRNKVTKLYNKQRDYHTNNSNTKIYKALFPVNT